MPQPINEQDDNREKLEIDIRQPSDGSRLVVNIRETAGDLVATNIQRKKRSAVPQPTRLADDGREQLHYDIRRNPDGTIVFNIRDGLGLLVMVSGKVDPSISPEVVAVSEGVIRDKTSDEQLADQAARDAKAK